jgi:hypothetical protein
MPCRLDTRTQLLSAAKDLMLTDRIGSMRSVAALRMT